MRNDEQSYISWLLDIVYPQRTNRGAPDYSALMDCLMGMDFIVYLDMDENRAFDGLELRSDYMNEYGCLLPETVANAPCSVLEMMIALSMRIERDITGEPGNDDESRWFWTMIDNLGLSGYTNDRFRADHVYQILDNCMQRNIKSNGKGGFWPLKNPKRDQRDADIWEQMCDYLSENYHF